MTTCALCQEIYIKGGSVEGFIAHYNKDHAGQPLPTNCQFCVHQCYICQLVTKTRRGLSRHLGSKHAAPRHKSRRPQALDAACDFPSLYQSRGGTYTVCLDRRPRSQSVPAPKPQADPPSNPSCDQPIHPAKTLRNRHPKPGPAHTTQHLPLGATGTSKKDAVTRQASGHSTRFPMRRRRPALGARASKSRFFQGSGRVPHGPHDS